MTGGLGLGVLLARSVDVGPLVAWISDIRIAVPWRRHVSMDATGRGGEGNRDGRYLLL